MEFSQLRKYFVLIISTIPVEKAAICHQNGIKSGKVNNSFSNSTCYNRKTAVYQPVIVLFFIIYLVFMHMEKFTKGDKTFPLFQLSMYQRIIYK